MTEPLIDLKSDQSNRIEELVKEIGKKLEEKGSAKKISSEYFCPYT